MPSLKIFKRRWHLATDDLVILGALNAFWHLYVVAAMIAGLVLLVNPLDCSNGRKLLAYFICMLIMASCWVVLSLMLAYFSNQGSIMENHKRRLVPYICTAIAIAEIPTLGVIIYGHSIFENVKDDPDCAYSEEGAIRSLTYSSLLGEWVCFFAFILVAVFAYNPYSGYQSIDHWKRRCKCIGFILCCCDAAKPSPHPTQDHLDCGCRSVDNREGEEEVAAPPLVRLARLFSFFYGSIDVTISDMLTGFVLVIVRRSLKESHEEMRLLSGPQEILGLPELTQSATPSQNVSPKASPPQPPTDAPPPPAPPLLHPPPPAPPLHHPPPPSPPLLHPPPPAIPLSPPSPPAPEVGGIGRDPSELTPQADNTQGAATGSSTGGLGLGYLPSASNVAARRNSSSDGRGEGVQAAHVALDINPFTDGVGTARIHGGDKGWNTDVCPDRKILEEAKHYLKHATAAYGYLMRVYSYRTRPWKCFGGCLDCCTHCGTKRHDDQPLVAMRTLNIEMIARLTGIDPKKELLFCNLLSITEGVLPYYILIDSKRNEVVISIRGTMSKTDALTDLLCEPAVIDLGIEITGGKNASQQTPMTDSPQDNTPGAPATQMVIRDEGTGAAAGSRKFFAHAGMLRSTKAILRDIDKRGILKAIMENDEEKQGKLGSALEDNIFKRDCRKMRLVVTGHSLGAGVGALLALYLKQRYAQTVCWAFAPPGGLMSPQVAESMRPYCTSVVIGVDIISRLSLHSVHSLNKEILDAAACCKVSKASFWFWTILGHKWSSEELFKSYDDVDEEVKTILSKGLAEFEASEMHNVLGDAWDFMAPGKIVYLKPVADPVGSGRIGMRDIWKRFHTKSGPKSDPSDMNRDVGASVSKAQSTPRKSAGVGQERFKPEWISNVDLFNQGILLKTNLLGHHMPDMQMRVIKSALKDVSYQ